MDKRCEMNVGLNPWEGRVYIDPLKFSNFVWDYKEVADEDFYYELLTHKGKFIVYLRNGFEVSLGFEEGRADYGYLEIGWSPFRIIEEDSKFSMVDEDLVFLKRVIGLSQEVALWNGK